MIVETKIKQLIELVKNSGKTLDELAEEADLDFIDFKKEFDTEIISLETLEKLSKVLGFTLYSFWIYSKIEDKFEKRPVYTKNL